MTSRNQKGNANEKFAKVKGLVSLPGVLPHSPRAAQAGSRISSWDDSDYLIIRMAQLKPTHSDGLSSRQSEVNIALMQVASFDVIKDWESNQQTALDTLLLELLEFVWELVAQNNIRVKLVDYVATYGSDTTAIWTEDGWESFLQELRANPIPMLEVILQIVGLLQPVVMLQPGNPFRGFPPSFLLYWTPHKTLAEMRTLRNSIFTHVHGLNHLKKIGHAFMKFVPDVIKILSPQVLPGATSVWAFFYNEMNVFHQPPAGDLPANQNVLDSAFDVDGGNIASGSYYYTPNDLPYYGYAFLKWINKYSAVNNPMGCLYYDEDDVIPKSGGNIAIADSEFAIIRAKFIQATELDYIGYAADENLVDIFGVIANGMTTATGSQTVTPNLLPMFSQLHSSTTHSSVWDNSVRNMIAQMIGMPTGAPKWKRSPSRRNKR
jgi:hypothetical protein